MTWHFCVCVIMNLISHCHLIGNIPYNGEAAYKLKVVDLIDSYKWVIYTMSCQTLPSQMNTVRRTIIMFYQQGQEQQNISTLNDIILRSSLIIIIETLKDYYENVKLISLFENCVVEYSITIYMMTIERANLL